MNFNEIFEKIENSITQALNKEDGILLGDKKIKFSLFLSDAHYSGKDFRIIDSDPVSVHVIQSQHSSDMWYVDVHNASYLPVATQYCVEELKKSFGKGTLISVNTEWFFHKNSFEIAITFLQ